MFSIERPIRVKFALFMAAVFSVVFLMGDFCTDVFSFPFEIEKNQIFSLSLDSQVGGLDGDIDIPEIPETDFELPETPEADIEITLPPGCFETDGQFFCSLSISHQKFDLTKGVKGIDKYKDNLASVFIRAITYAVIENSMFFDIPPIGIFISPKVQGTEEGQYDWTTALANGYEKYWNLQGDGEGDVCEPNPDDPDAPTCHLAPLILVGRTCPINALPVQVPGGVSAWVTMQGGNIGYVSDIMKNLAFEIIIAPLSGVSNDSCIDQTDGDNDLAAEYEAPDLSGPLEINRTFPIPDLNNDGVVNAMDLLDSAEDLVLRLRLDISVVAVGKAFK